MEPEDPSVLLGRLKLGREEFVQRLLTMLVLDASYPRWNSAHPPSPQGARFLEMLEELSYGEAGSWTDPDFIDELDLPRRHDDEPGSAPDWAVRDQKRLWMIELKTEAGSHRPAQLPAYFELGRHHHPTHRIDLTYLTGPLRKDPPTVPEGSRFAHVTWDQLLPMIDEVWAESHPTQVAMLHDVLGTLGSPWSEWRSARLGVPAIDTGDPVEIGIEVARQTAVDHQQRGVDVPVASLEELQRVRVDLGDALLADEATASVKPWIWRPASGGQPLTALGAEVGYELRVSWYR